MPAACACLEQRGDCGIRIARAEGGVKLGAVAVGEQRTDQIRQFPRKIGFGPVVHSPIIGEWSNLRRLIFVSWRPSRTLTALHGEGGANRAVVRRPGPMHAHTGRRCGYLALPERKRSRA